MKKLLVIVPHQDDEISIAGAVLVACKHKAIKPYVVFTTNGDAYQCDEKIRFYESQKALSILGINSDQILYLGFPDMYKNENNLYNMPSSKNIVHNGHTKTYGTDDFPEYRFKRDGVHSEYTKGNYKKDLFDAINEIFPNIIIVNNYDFHPEHRMTYLITLEVLREILIFNHGNYKPLLFTKFAYSNNWLGASDYFEKPLKGTVQTENIIENPEAMWSDRLCFSVPPECQTVLLKDNILYKSILAYKSQQAWIYAPNFINSDVCYWQKRTDNLALLAKVDVSSGDGNYLNDFKVIDSSNIVCILSDFDKCVWSPEQNDNVKMAVLSWEKPINISKIVVYENPDWNSHIYSLSIILDNGFCIKNIEPNRNGSASEVLIDSQQAISHVSITIERSEGDVPGLTEIEIFDKEQLIEDYGFPLKRLDSLKKKAEGKGTYEKYTFPIKKMIFHKIFPNIYVMRRKYEILNRNPFLLPMMWIVRLISYLLRRDRNAGI